jgi:hypothetical protein
MSYLDIYNQRNADYGGSLRDVSINATKRNIKLSFFNSPSYYQVQVNTPSNPTLASNLDSWIVDDSKIKELKQIQLIPDQVLNFGDIILWNGQRWITTQVDNMGGIYYRGSIQRCFSSLKWLDSTGETREAWFTLTSETRSLGIQDGKVLIMPYERRYLAIQSNAYTQQIKKDQRFIFDNRVWKTVSIDGLLTGLIMLTLEENLESNANDRMDLRIADYTNNIHTYSINIVNGSSATIIAGSTMQLNVETKDNEVVSNLPVTYTSSDVTKAMVSNTGLVTAIADGSTTITVAIVGHPSVTTSILLSVSTVVVDNFTVNISGADECKVTQSQSYIASIYNNSVVDNTKSVVWSLVGDDLGFTTLASIDSQTGTGCTIKSNSVSPYQYGFIKLVATMVENPNATQVKRIKIRSLF